MITKDVTVKAKDILVIEDSDEMRDIYQEYFEEEKQYRLDFAASAAEGAQRLGKKDFDLIILDVVMDNISGDSFCEYIRTSPHTEKIPILLVSVLEEKILANLKDRYGASYLRKPVDKTVLLQQIERTV